ncbi:MMPL family transporter [Streptomyces sp. NPDC090112]|uniref:MMPL family transporter n=1 Tax=Streptomyces sp. NPDC090112 TaxID=3365949 RepID=UPI003818C4DD
MWKFHRAGPLAVLLLWLALAVAAGPYTMRLGEVAPSSQAVQLPAGAESARVARLLNPTAQDDLLPLAVIWTPRKGGEQITAAQRQAVRQVTARLAGSAAVPVLAVDGRALTAVIAAGPSDLAAQLKAIRQAATTVDGTHVDLAGPAAAQADLDGAFAKTDSMLLAVTLAGVLLILLAVYRSLVIPLLVIAGALVALAAACAVLYALARPGWLAIDGQTQGIVFVLAIGASTDYALLLAARHREELPQHPDAAQAMKAACRATAPPVLASAATIACAMMTLTFSDLPAEQALGPAVAIAMACCAAVSLTFLPALLLVCGRRALRPATASQTGEDGRRTKAGRAIECRPRRVWAGCLVLLAAGAACAPFLAQSGVPLHQALPAGSPSATGQHVLARHFPAGTASPLIIIAPATRTAEVREKAAATPGVAATDVHPGPERTAQVMATQADAPDSAQARATVVRLRGSLAGTGALVGGQSAQLTDLHETSVGGHRLIMPLVLAVVLVVLIVLLRCLLLPLLLVAAAWVSLFTAFGAAALVLQLVVGSAATEPAVVLFSFVFLVALGVDYNIFLVHRIRAEALHHGTTAGVHRALATTSGVISAAGLILAATFAALIVMPLLYLAQIGCIVAIGVLIDTLLVRLFLVPALILDLGPRTWWPTRLPADLSRPRIGPPPHMGEPGLTTASTPVP